VKTEIYEADPFTNQKTAHFLTLDTDYRFEPRDEFFLTTEKGQKLKVRVTYVRVEVSASGLRRELIVMKL
jgi:hypothetical protein